MKFFRNLIALFGLLLAVYSCEPDEMSTESASTAVTELDAVIATDVGTETNAKHHGDKDDEVDDSHD